MAQAVRFSGTNMVLKPPVGSENVADLHTFTNGNCSVSCWELSPEELAEINRTGRVFVSILSGHTQPPVFVGSQTIMRGFLVDYGGTWRAEQ